jgi:hypothetical protein
VDTITTPHSTPISASPSPPVQTAFSEEKLLCWHVAGLTKRHWKVDHLLVPHADKSRKLLRKKLTWWYTAKTVPAALFCATA